MAVEWKKVLTTADVITSDAGGTGVSDWTNDLNEVLISPSAAGGAFQSVALTDGKILAGVTGSTPVAATFAADSDIQYPGTATAGTAMKLDILDGAVIEAKIANNAVDWSTKTKHTNAAAGYSTVPYWAHDGEPGIVPGNLQGDGTTATADSNVLMLKTIGGQLTPSWEAGTSLTASVGFTDMDAVNTAANPYAVAMAATSSSLGTDEGSSPLTWDPHTHTLVAENVTGTASQADKIKVNEESDNTAANLPLLFGDSATINGSQSTVYARTTLTFNPAGANNAGVLTVPNLKVTGTTTTVNTTDLNIADAVIRLGTGDSNSAAAETDAVGAALAADPGTSTQVIDANLPKLVYTGAGDTTSPSGWKVSKGVATLNSAAPQYGVGVVHVQNTTVAADTGLDIGVGAFQYSDVVGANGGLWIQTSV